MKKYSKSIALGLSIMATAWNAYSDNLVILHTNDTHSQIDPVAEDGLGGIARRKVVIDSVRNAQDNVILIDAGDIVQGTLFFNLYRGEVEEKLMNALGYDIRIIGNHEFDNGMQSMADNLDVSEATLICSNYDTRQTPLKDSFKKWTYKEINGKKIAFMPINLQPKGMISSRNTQGLEYVDAIEAANNLAWYLKHIENMDYVVAITHIGYQPDKMLVESSKDIDLLIGGHSHTLVRPDHENLFVKNADGKDILITQVGKSGKYVGKITIDLDDLDKKPEYDIIRIDSRLDNRVDSSVEEIVQPYREKTDSLNSNYIAKTAFALKKESPEALNFVADFIDYRGRQLANYIDLAIINKGGIRNSLPKGKISEGELISMLPFFNHVQVIEVSGKNLAIAFDTMAAADGNGVSANVTAVYDPESNQCLEVLIDGEPINPDKTYRVATIDYLAEGGDYMQSLADHTLIAESPNHLFEDIVNYFVKGEGRGKTIKPSDKIRMRPLEK